MRTEIYVGNCHPDSSVEELARMFSEAGTVCQVKLIFDEENLRRSFCFVAMSSEEEAMKAIARFNRCMFHGRELAVSKARGITARPDYLERG